MVLVALKGKPYSALIGVFKPNSAVHGHEKYNPIAPSKLLRQFGCARVNKKLFQVVWYAQNLEF